MTLHSRMRILMPQLGNADNWETQDPDFPRIWIEAHDRASAAMGKPLVLEEVGTLPALLLFGSLSGLQRCYCTCMMVKTLYAVYLQFGIHVGRFWQCTCM